MFIYRHPSCHYLDNGQKHNYTSLPDNATFLHYSSIEESGSSVSICDTCDSLQSRFDDKYYSKNNIWYFHRSDRFSMVTLFDYPTIHSL